MLRCRLRCHMPFSHDNISATLRFTLMAHVTPYYTHTSLMLPPLLLPPLLHITVYAVFSFAMLIHLFISHIRHDKPSSSYFAYAFLCCHAAYVIEPADAAATLTLSLRHAAAILRCFHFILAIATHAHYTPRYHYD